MPAAAARSTSRGVTVATIDAADAEAVTRLVEGSVAVYNAINPPKYHRWPTDWPPIATALLTAAERTGTTLVTASNLYAYGPVSEPMREGMPDASTDTKGVVRANVGRGPCGPPRRSGPRRRGALLRLRRRRRGRAHPAAGPGGAGRQDRAGARQPGHAAPGPMSPMSPG